MTMKYGELSIVSELFGFSAHQIFFDASSKIDNFVVQNFFKQVKW